MTYTFSSCDSQARIYVFRITIEYKTDYSMITGKPPVLRVLWKKKSNWALKVKVLVAQSCLIYCNPMDCSPPGSSVHGILQAKMLEWVAMPFSRGSSQPRDWTWVSCIAGGFFIVWATREAYILRLKRQPPNMGTRYSIYSFVFWFEQRSHHLVWWKSRNNI